LIEKGTEPCVDQFLFHPRDPEKNEQHPFLSISYDPATKAASHPEIGMEFYYSTKSKSNLSREKSKRLWGQGSFESSAPGGQLPFRVAQPRSLVNRFSFPHFPLLPATLIFAPCSTPLAGKAIFSLAGRERGEGLRLPGLGTTLRKRTGGSGIFFPLANHQAV
jgi:hypothetical protein